VLIRLIRSARLLMRLRLSFLPPLKTCPYYPRHHYIRCCRGHRTLVGAICLAHSRIHIRLLPRYEGPVTRLCSYDCLKILKAEIVFDSTPRHYPHRYYPGL